MFSPYLLQGTDTVSTICQFFLYYDQLDNTLFIMLCPGIDEADAQPGCSYALVKVKARSWQWYSSENQGTSAALAHDLQNLMSESESLPFARWRNEAWRLLLLSCLSRRAPSSSTTHTHNPTMAPRVDYDPPPGTPTS